MGDIKDATGHDLNFPLIADPDRKVADLYGMIHPNASDTLTVRSVFVIGPDKKVKLTITYPASTGRNFQEILRVLDSLQLTSSYSVATPVNWTRRRGRHHRPGAVGRGRQGASSRRASERRQAVPAATRPSRTAEPIGQLSAFGARRRSPPLRRRAPALRPMAPGPPGAIGAPGPGSGRLASRVHGPTGGDHYDHS